MHNPSSNVSFAGANHLDRRGSAAVKRERLRPSVLATSDPKDRGTHRKFVVRRPHQPSLPEVVFHFGLAR